jgi:hypothetical protein
MADQFHRNNINFPRETVSTTTAIQLTSDSDLIVIPSGSPTVTLPDARTIPGRRLVIKSISGSATVEGLDSQTIDDVASFTFFAIYQALCLKSDGSNWIVECLAADTGLNPATVLFDDDATVDVLVGTTATAGYIVVEGNVTQTTGSSMAYRADIAVTATGADGTILEACSDVPVTTIIPTIVEVTGSVFLRLTGSGIGVSSAFRWANGRTMARALG